MQSNFINIKDICAQTGFTASAIYQQIDRKVFPKAIKWGRLSKWLNDDVQRVLNARANRKSEDEIKAIVAEINASNAPNTPASAPAPAPAQEPDNAPTNAPTNAPATETTEGGDALSKSDNYDVSDSTDANTDASSKNDN